MFLGNQPVRVSVRHESRRRCPVKLKSMVDGALEVAKDAFQHVVMWLARIVHVEACLLDRVSNV